MAQAVEKQAHECGYTLIISSSESNAEKERQLIRALRAQQVDGLIIAPIKRRTLGHPFHDGRAHIPLYSSTDIIPNWKPTTSSWTTRRAVAGVVSRLIGAGCRRIALLTTDTHLLVMGRRIQGYRDALAGAGIDADPALCVEVNRANYVEAVVAELDALFERAPM